jgi:hypothetical protein
MVTNDVNLVIFAVEERILLSFVLAFLSFQRTCKPLSLYLSPCPHIRRIEAMLYKIT